MYQVNNISDTNVEENQFDDYLLVNGWRDIAAFVWMQELKNPLHQQLKELTTYTHEESWQGRI